MGTMQRMIIREQDGNWELEEVDIPSPGAGEVLVRVKASGICGTDVWFSQAKLAFGPFPLSLGHECVGEIVEIGDGVSDRHVGDRVGVMPLQAGCGTCAWCQRHEHIDFVTAQNCAAPVLTGFGSNGAQAEYYVAHASGTVVLPDGLSYEAAAPIMCAGYTAWSGLRRADPNPRDVIAVSGLGGVGHLAIQYAKAAGHRTIAITSAADKHETAMSLGADAVVTNGAELAAIGGADVLLSTNSSNKALMDHMAGLRPRGTVVVMGISFDELAVTNMAMVMNSIRVLGSAHNGPQYLAEAMQIAGDGHVRPVLEVFDKSQINDAYQRVLLGQARYRAVVTY
jgi:D-arabinose 1-dehydrogenase-like Zn-dependent alcohol dehydrogenase